MAVFDGAALPAVDPLTVALIDDNTLIVVNKSDRFGGIVPVIGGRRALAVSVHSGSGIVELMTRITEWVAARLDTAGLPTMTRLRHRVAVTEARDAVRRALAAPLSELVAEDVRLATRGLGRITGRVTVEEVLDVIFKDFCIGK